jgi:EAL domain-containing protein (putative c-di-GMP-specific phosphodiesterase class I)/CBS domain-containing protein
MDVSRQCEDAIDVRHLPLESPVTLEAAAPLSEAIALMTGQIKGSPQSCLILTEQGNMVGILTERDFVRLALTDKTIRQTSIRDVMTSPVVAIAQESFTDIFSAYSLMRRHRIRHLPVLAADQSVIGVITLSLLRQALHLGYFLRFREVREIMSNHVITAQRNSSVQEVAELMARHRISCVVIVEHQAGLVLPIGVITERDIVQLQGMEAELTQLTTAEIMSAPLMTLRPHDSLAIAQETMQRYHIRRVVITGEQGELQGVVTETNLSQVLDPLELFGMLEILQHRVQQLVEDRDRLLPQDNIHLHQALENNEFLLHYQPQLNHRTGVVVGAEVLVRWHCPQRGMISPDTFIPLAEMTGFILPLGEWILREACLQLVCWQQEGLPPLKLSVNISSRQLQNPSFVQIVKQIITTTGINPKYLVLELTESSLVENIELTLAQFQALKKLGVAIAIDDFGTGYASLGYLQHFPFDILKIDRCFVDNIHHNAKNSAITSAIIRMAEQLNFLVIAEGLEQPEEMAHLSQLNCDIVQGYLISKPIPAAQFKAFYTQSLIPFATP